MSTILKEIFNVENGMKDTNKPIFNNPDNKKRSRDLDVAILMFLKNAIILKEFISNPVQSCNDITRIHADLPYSKDFVELTKAINCSHTKEQGVTIGVRKIVEYLGKVKDECIEKSKSLSIKGNEVKMEINTSKDLASASFDIDTLNRRYQQATENEYFSKHTENNIDKILVPEAIAVSPLMSVNKFLKTILKMYTGEHKLRVLDEVTNFINDVAKDIEGKVAYIEANNKYINSTQFNKTRFEFPEFKGDVTKFGTSKKQDYYKEQVDCYFAQVQGDNEVNDKLATLKQLVDGTNGKVTEVRSAIDNFELAIAKLIEAGEKASVGSTLELIYNDLITKMGNMEITLDEYSSAIDKYKIVLQNLAMLRDRAETLLEIAKGMPGNYFYIEDKIYKFIDKILVKSTMYKGQEKQPQVIVNDTTPPQGAGR